MYRYSIRRTWMEHTSGSKFYQAIELGRESDFSPSGLKENWTVFVAHFGKMSSAKGGAFSRPVAGGTVQIKRGAELYTTKVREKEGRGYRAVAGSTKEQNVTTERGFRADLQALFGATDAHEILTHLGMVDAVTPTDAPPTPAPDHSEAVAETAIERPDTWGSW